LQQFSEKDIFFNIGVILKLPPIKQAMANQQMKSVYLETILNCLNI